MKYRSSIIFLVAAAVIIGLAVVVVNNRGNRQQPEWAAQLNDTLLTRLSQDEREARTNLQKARRMLDKLKPTKNYIVINTHTNKVLMRNEDSVIFGGSCSTGSGAELIDSLTGRHWIFDTPRGVFKVTSKIKQPWWRKPDWAYIEEGESLPKSESERLDPEMMGGYAIGFGDGYFIHGTIYERLLGINVTHGCVRLGSEDLEKLYERTPIGMPIYIF